MEDMNEKLNTLLSDPDSMSRIVQLARQLSGGGEAPQNPPPFTDIDPQLIAKFLPFLQEISRDDSRTTQLLFALRPFLKEEKQNKVERAARLARLICIGKRFLGEGGGTPV